MSPSGERLDQWLVAHGYARSGHEAQAAIMAGVVTVDGTVVDKPGRRVGPGVRVSVISPAHPFVGRGGVKLAHALRIFRIDVRGRAAVDLGHSLRLETVAEGVKDEQLWDLLAALGCDTAQGYCASPALARRGSAAMAGQMGGGAWRFAESRETTKPLPRLSRLWPR